MQRKACMVLEWRIQLPNASMRSATFKESNAPLYSANGCSIPGWAKRSTLLVGLKHRSIIVCGPHTWLHNKSIGQEFKPGVCSVEKRASLTVSNLKDCFPIFVQHWFTQESIIVNARSGHTLVTFAPKWPRPRPEHKCFLVPECQRNDQDHWRTSCLGN